MTIEEKANRIIEDIRNEKGVNPICLSQCMKNYRNQRGKRNDQGCERDGF